MTEPADETAVAVDTKMAPVDSKPDPVNGSHETEQTPTDESKTAQIDDVRHLLIVALHQT